MLYAIIVNSKYNVDCSNTLTDYFSGSPEFLVERLMLRQYFLWGVVPDVVSSSSINTQYNGPLWYFALVIVYIKNTVHTVVVLYIILLLYV